MTKAQALALMNAIEGQAVPAAAHMAFPPAPGAETWTVTIPPEFALTGAQLVQLANYCAANGLVLSAQFAYLGVA